MVLIKRVKGGLGRRVRKVYGKEKLGAAVGVCGFVFSFLLWKVVTYGSSSAEDAEALQLRRIQHPNLGMADFNSENYNAIALDIIQTLKCTELLNQTSYDEYPDEEEEMTAEEQANFYAEPDPKRRRRRRLRRLEEGGIADAAAEGGAGEGGAIMDDRGVAGEYDGAMAGGGMAVSGKTLFCLAAQSHHDTSLSSKWKGRVRCDAAGNRQKAMLDLWSAARAEMEESVLVQALDESTEMERDFMGTTRHFWSPSQDEGLDYSLSLLNDNTLNAAAGNIKGLGDNLGPDRVFVDVGSCLGLMSMAVAAVYPGTTVVGMEAASPNWLYQEMNWRCNPDLEGKVDRTLILAGVGPSAPGDSYRKSSQMAKFLWRPAATTSTRAWTPASEHVGSDIELHVKLRPWHSLVREAGIANKRIDVLNVDCEGCEYNLIPALSESEFRSVPVVVGGIHWGYIPVNKLPSSARAKITHERLCSHENFARAAKECCDFPDLKVTPAVPGEATSVRDIQKGGGGPDEKSSTVRELAGELCNDFTSWAAKHHLHSIENDWGWFQITSMAN